MKRALDFFKKVRKERIIHLSHRMWDDTRKKVYVFVLPISAWGKQRTCGICLHLGCFVSSTEASRAKYAKSPRHRPREHATHHRHHQQHSCNLVTLTIVGLLYYTTVDGDLICRVVGYTY